MQLALVMIKKIIIKTDDYVYFYFTRINFVCDRLFDIIMFDNV